MRVWLASSARHPDGGLAGWIDPQSSSPSPPYPEITGYALTFVAGLDHPTASELAVGSAAARWLLDRLDRGLSAPVERHGTGIEYSFDLAIISTGLQRFGAVIDDVTFIDAGKAIAHRLVSEVEATGLLEPLTRASSITERGAWSTRGHAHLIKASQCLLLADRGGLPGARAAADAIIARGIEDIFDDGRCMTPPDTTTLLHPHLYAVEGLWMYAECTQDERAARLARQAACWAWTQQARSGGFPRSAGQSRTTSPEQGDATAQALRAASLMGLAAGDIAGAIGWLRRSAVKIDDGWAILYQPGTELAHPNVWSTMFAYQALAVANGRKLAWDELV